MSDDELTAAHPAVDVALAARIEAAHHAACAQARSALAHAFECGRLLLEAKTAVGHGGWLAWVRAHTTMTPRQAQRYMQLAQQRDALEAKYDSLSHLTPTGALAQLATPRPVLSDSAHGPLLPPLAGPPDFESWEELARWADALLDSPFSAWDFEADGGWLRTKLFHQMRLPAVVAMCLQWAGEYQLPALRLASDDDLLDALRVLAPHARGTAPALPFDATGMSSLAHRNHLAGLHIRAQCATGACLNELEARGVFRPRHRHGDKARPVPDAEQLARERQTVHAQLMQCLDGARARLEAERGVAAGSLEAP